MQERYLVEHVGEPLAFLLPVDIEAHKGVGHRLTTCCHLCRQTLLGEVLQGTRQLKVFGKVVFPVDAEHRLSLHAVVAVALK